MGKQDLETEEIIFEEDQDNLDDPSLEDEQEQDEEIYEEEQDEPESEHEGEQDSDPEDEDDDDVLVSFGDEEPEQQDEEDGTPLIKKLRKLEREKAKENRELKKKLAKYESNASESEAKALPPKPTLDAFDYDDDKFESALLDWHEKKREIDKQERAKQEEAEQQQKAWEQSQKKYSERKQELGFRDFDDVEEVVSSTLSAAQQNLIVGGSNDSAKLIYAIGKSPKKLEELAAIKDPVKFIWTVAQLEGQVKVESKTRKPSARPEKHVRGNGTAKGIISSQLKRLTEEADRTGDYSKVVAYKRANKLKK